MAIVTIDLVSNSLTGGQKRDLIYAVTEAVLSVQGPVMRNFTVVRINEAPEGNVAIGGNVLSSDDIHRHVTFLSSLGRDDRAAPEENRAIGPQQCDDRVGRPYARK